MVCNVLKYHHMLTTTTYGFITSLLLLHNLIGRLQCVTYTAFTLTRFGSVISSGTVTKHSMNVTEPCRTNPCWNLQTEPGQHGSVRFGCSASVNTSITVLTVSPKWRTCDEWSTKFAIISGRVLRVSYERFLLQRYYRQRVDRQSSTFHLYPGALILHALD